MARRGNYGLGTGKRGWRFRPHHAVTLIVLALLVVPLAWVLLAYTALPRIWLHHEHRKGPSEALTAFTAQGIPGDPVNLHYTGDAASLGCLLNASGWHKADPVTLRSSLGIIASIAFDKPADSAPVSPLYIDERQQDFAYEVLQGRSADKRHHVRFWPVGPNQWLGAATYDRGIGFSLFTLQVTHHIGPDVDKDRDMVAGLMLAHGATRLADEDAHLGGSRWHRNGGGDRYETDGHIVHLAAPSSGACHP